jgi:acetyl-CoA acetyltransferase
MIGQTMIRGQTCLSDLMDQGILPERLPIVNVEGACATGSLAFHLAWKDVLSGQSDLALAIGVEKLYDPAVPGRVLEEIGGGFDRCDQQRWIDEYAGLAARAESNGRPARSARSRWTLMVCRRAITCTAMERHASKSPSPSRRTTCMAR